MRKITTFIAILLLITLTTCACTVAPGTNSGTSSIDPSPSATRPTETHTTAPTLPVTEKHPSETTTPTEPTDPIMATTAPTEPTTEPIGPPLEATEPTASHYCAYAPVETVPATCTEQGYTLYVCDCGKSFKAIQEATEHEYVEINQQAPTDTEPGCRVLQCSVCGHIIYQPMEEGEG